MPRSSKRLAICRETACSTRARQAREAHHHRARRWPTADSVSCTLRENALRWARITRAGSGCIGASPWAIEQLTQGRTNPPLARSAHHFAQSASASVASKAVDYATRAGDHAADGLRVRRSGAPLRAWAATSLEFAEDEVAANVRRVDLHGRRAKVFGGIGQWMQQRQEVEHALRYLDPQQEERRCALLIDLAHASFFLLDMERLQRSATEALELATRLQRNDYAADALAWLARWEQANGNLVTAIEMDRAAFTRSGGRSRYALMNGTLSLYLAGHQARHSIRMRWPSVSHVPPATPSR
jgi:hypothetical protein